jgi:hypothetical protein
VVNVRYNRQIANVVTCRMFFMCCHNSDSILIEPHGGSTSVRFHDGIKPFL